MKHLSTSVVCAVLAAAGLACGGPARDPSPPAAGAPARPARRIVSVAPSATEILFALGAGDRVAGVSDHSTWPAAASARPKVGGYSTPSLEAVLACEPDLVVFVPTVVRDASAFEAALTAAGSRVLHIRMGGIDSVYESIAAIAAAIGDPAAGTQLAGTLRAELAAAQAEFAGRAPPRVVVTLSHEPHALWVAGPKSFVAELLTLAGATNALADGAGYYAITSEALLAADPDVIVDAAGPMEKPDDARRGSAEFWTHFPALRAVRERRVRLALADSLIRPGPRLPEAVRLLGRLIHGDAGGAGGEGGEGGR